jgi:LysM repeat protein
MLPTRRLWLTRGAIAAVLTLAGCSGSSHLRTSPTTVSSTTTTVAPTTTTLGVTRYQVRQGDTLSAIAARFHVSSATIVTLNHLANPDQLQAGQVLSIPNPPPVPKPGTPGQSATLAISPTVGPPGQVFSLTLSSAKPGETVTFQINSPGGASYTGPTHTVPVSGVVAAGYATSGGDPSGQYKVIAKGNQGTSAQATFVVNASVTTTSSG